MNKFTKIEGVFGVGARQSQMRLIFNLGLSLPEVRLKVQVSPPIDADDETPHPKNGDTFSLVFEDETIEFFIYKIDRFQYSELEVIGLLNKKDFLTKVEQKVYDDNVSNILKQMTIGVDIDFQTNDKQKYLRFNQIEKEFVRHCLYHMDATNNGLYYISQKGLVVRDVNKLKQQESKTVGAYSSLVISSLPYNFDVNQKNSGFVEFLLSKDDYKNQMENTNRNFFIGDAGNTQEKFYKNFYENYKNLIDLYQNVVEVVVSMEVYMFDVLYLYNEKIKILVIGIEYNISNQTLFESVKITGVII